MHHNALVTLYIELENQGGGLIVRCGVSGNEQTIAWILEKNLAGLFIIDIVSHIVSHLFVGSLRCPLFDWHIYSLSTSSYFVNGLISLKYELYWHVWSISFGYYVGCSEKSILIYSGNYHELTKSAKGHNNVPLSHISHQLLMIAVVLNSEVETTIRSQLCIPPNRFRRNCSKGNSFPKSIGRTCGLFVV